MTYNNSSFSPYKQPTTAGHVAAGKVVSANSAIINTKKSNSKFVLVKPDER